MPCPDPGPEKVKEAAVAASLHDVLTLNCDLHPDLVLPVLRCALRLAQPGFAQGKGQGIEIQLSLDAKRQSQHGMSVGTVKLRQYGKGRLPHHLQQDIEGRLLLP